MPINYSRLFSRTLRLAVPLAMTTVLWTGWAEAGPVVDAVLDKQGEKEWGGAYLIESPEETGKSIVLLPKGCRVIVHVDQTKSGYFFVDRVGENNRITKSGWVHRKFLRFADGDSSPAVKAEAEKTPFDRIEDRFKSLEKRLTAMETQLAALGVKDEDLAKKISEVEKNGGVDPGADFLQRLQKLEIEVRAREQSTLAPHAYPPRSASEPAAQRQPLNVPGMSWLFKGW